MPTNETPAARERWILADRLRGLIHQRQAPSYASVARAAGVSLSNLRYALAGRPPRAGTLRRILQALEATPDDLIAAPAVPPEHRYPPGPRRQTPSPKPVKKNFPNREVTP